MLREKRAYDADAPANEIFEREALLFALQSPQKRAEVLRDLGEQMFNQRDRVTGES